MFRPQVTPFSIHEIAPPIHAASRRPQDVGARPFDIGPSLLQVSRAAPRDAPPVFLSRRFNRVGRGGAGGTRGTGNAGSNGPGVVGGGASGHDGVPGDATAAAALAAAVDAAAAAGGLGFAAAAAAGDAADYYGGGGDADAPATPSKKAAAANTRNGSPLGAGKDEKKSRSRKSHQQPISLNPDESYTPFHLADKSSFNIAKLNSRKVKSMDRLTRSKYMAYEKPAPEIIQNIDESSARAKMWFRQENRKFFEQCHNLRAMLARKRGVVSLEEEEVAQINAQKVTERIQEKFRNMSLARERELAFLVEGQPNAIDAIKLKEYLATKPKPLDRLFGRC